MENILMLRIRTIKPDLYRHFELYEIERKYGINFRAAFPALFCCCDKQGRFRWDPRSLKLDILPYDDIDFSVALDVLNEHGFIKKYESEGKFYGFIPTWALHQVINNREKESSLPIPNENNIIDASITRDYIKKEDVNSCNGNYSGEGKGREWEGNGKGMGMGREGNGNRREGKGKVPKREKKLSTADYSDDFSLFWDCYPEKKGKLKAFNSWKSIRNLPSVDKIISAILRQDEERGIKKLHGAFVPAWKHPASWLNAACWEDGVSTEDDVIREKSQSANGGQYGLVVSDDFIKRIEREAEAKENASK